MLALRSRKFTIVFVMTALVALTLILWLGSPNRTEQAQIAFDNDNLIRLHVVANSDTVSDQALKLQVRDSVLEASGSLLHGIQNWDQAWEILRDNLDILQSAASRRVLAEGYDYPVQVDLNYYPFPTKAYGNAVLAAGVYPAVRVTLGTGAGRNWWCVLFPPLCFLNMSGPLAAERIEKTPIPAKESHDEAVVSVDFSSPFGVPAKRIPVAAPGMPIQ